MSTLAAANTLIAGRKLVGPIATVGGPGKIDASELNVLGSFAFDQYGNEYVYLKGVTATAVGSWVMWDELGVTVLMTTALVGPVAIATAINDASTTYSWYAVKGTHPGLALTAMADNATANGTATAGSVDDNLVATAAESQVFGAISRGGVVNETSLLSTFQIYHPYKSAALLD